MRVSLDYDNSVKNLVSAIRDMLRYDIQSQQKSPALDLEEFVLEVHVALEDVFCAIVTRRGDELQVCFGDKESYRLAISRIS